MRLLNTASITLEEYLGENIPPYAILSHTWEKEEVLLADILNGTASTKKGYSKLIGCCQKAAQHGFDWVWIDTCCIDKTSSAELSEAINSMYQWYETSAICYAYLQDVSVASGKTRAPRITVNNFGQSRWFTRGWTLQELLAPKAVEFYTSEWEEIGTKASLSTALSARTTIPKHILCGEALVSCSVAERMSWASTRQTTRLEDMAYCLLGLFSVNMPLLYGEGRKAFLRLQEQIMKQEEDYSLFAWTFQHDVGQSLFGILASSPADFSKTVPQQFSRANEKGEFVMEEDRPDFSGKMGKRYLEFETFSHHFGYSGSHIKVLYDKNYERIQKHQPYSFNSKFVSKEPPELTSRGLRITLPVMGQWHSNSPAIAWLYCESDEMLICIGLAPCAEPDSTLIGRHASSWLISVDKSELGEFVMRELLIHPNGLIQGGTFRGPNSSPSLSDPVSTWGRLRVVMEENDDDDPHYSYVTSAFPIRQWSLDEFFFAGAPEVMGVLMVVCSHDKASAYMAVCCGLRKERPWCTIRQFTNCKDDDVTSKLETIYYTAADDCLGGKDRSDRAATMPWGLFGPVFTSAIRRAPGFKQTHAYTLHIGARSVEKCSSWVPPCLQVDQTEVQTVDRYLSD